MKVVIPGGTGQIGAVLARHYSKTLGPWRRDTELILKSRRVVPGRLLGAGFAFAFPTWPEAAADLFARVRAARAA